MDAMTTHTEAYFRVDTMEPGCHPYIVGEPGWHEFGRRQSATDAAVLRDECKRRQPQRDVRIVAVCTSWISQVIA